MTILSLLGQRWTETFVNHLWQSTAVAVAAWALSWALKKNQARVRYGLWMAASVKFLLPFSLLMAAGEWMRSMFPATAVTHPGVANAMEQAAQPFAVGEVLGPAPSLAHAHHSHWLMVAILVVWGCGALVVLARFAQGWWKVRAAKRIAVPVGVVREGQFYLSGAEAPDLDENGDGPSKLVRVRFADTLYSKNEAKVVVLSSPALIEPGIFGIFRPVLLLPDGILERLTAEQVRAIVAHEMAHVRRRDNLTFALHMLAEILFWFYPPVWWIGARLIEEREHACDEAVVESSRAAEIYAEGILNVCKFYVESPLACAAGVTGADLKKRILRIMSQHRGLRLSPGRKVAVAASAAIALGIPVVLGWGQVQAAKVELVHSPDGTKHVFEVATIKPAANAASPTRIQLSPAHYAATNISVDDMIRMAYGVKSDAQLEGAPSWLKTERYDIQAKASDADIAALDKLGMAEKMTVPRLLMQNLLEDRFQLKATVETRDLPVYALVVTSGGMKMKEVKPDPLPGAGIAPTPGGHYTRFARTAPNEFTASAWPMSQFAEGLSHFYEVGNRPVLDETGLKGNYDFVLSGVSMTPPPAAGEANANGAQAPEASLFAALPEQLGLKLVPVKAPTEVLVIQSIERPSAN